MLDTYYSNRLLVLPTMGPIYKSMQIKSDINAILLASPTVPEIELFLPPVFRDSSFPACEGHVKVMEELLELRIVKSLG